MEMALEASVEIVEQPAPTAPFRSVGCVGWLHGVHSTSANKTYPTIRINNYQGNITVVVYCSNKDEPLSPHPHKLVDSEGISWRVFTFKAYIGAYTNECQLRELGIQRGNRYDIQKEVQQHNLAFLNSSGNCTDSGVNRALSILGPWSPPTLHRLQSTVNNTASNEIAILSQTINANKALNKTPRQEAESLLYSKERKTNPKYIDLDAVRVVFQVYLHGEEQNLDFTKPLSPVVSDVIRDDMSLPRRRDLLTPYDLLNEITDK